MVFLGVSCFCKLLILLDFAKLKDPLRLTGVFLRKA